MSTCEDLAHTGAAYYVNEEHSAVVLIVLAFVPHLC